MNSEFVSYSLFCDHEATPAAKAEMGEIDSDSKADRVNTRLIRSAPESSCCGPACTSLYVCSK
jgi:hypothetical protein